MMRHPSVTEVITGKPPPKRLNPMTLMWALMVNAESRPEYVRKLDR
jgi:hypothetical protein